MAPFLFGCVNNPGHCDDQSAAELQQDESHCTFVVSDKREWEKKNEPNTITIVLKNDAFTIVDGPPKNTRKEKREGLQC